MGYNATNKPQYNFNIIFQILLKLHIVQPRITFNKDSEIHLNGRKYQICLKILETPTR